MMTDISLLALREAAIQKSMQQLFSTGTLADKIKHAMALRHMPGLSIFMTAVPWSITVAQNEPMQGYSENLSFACDDIHAQLVALEKNLPSETAVQIGLVAKRLASEQRGSPRSTSRGT